jgi:cysteinyl-tRNA synthetase
MFPHHENEIAQSEAATGRPFVRTWLHAEHLLVEGERMAKSKGNYYTLRDLLAQGHKPAAIRYLLASVPRRKQLNFTFDGLHQAAQSVERLRNFRLRLATEKFPAGTSDALAKRIEQAGAAFDTALDDDLNTAEALGAVFDLVRELNTAMDRGEFPMGNRAATEALLARYDGVFAVLAEEVSRAGLSDSEVEGLLAERRTARARRDFARADEIRRKLADRGIIVEDTKDGVRWKRQ